MTALAKEMIQWKMNEPNPPRLLLRVRDLKFSVGKALEGGRSFETALRKARIRPMMLSSRAPNLSAIAERIAQALQHASPDCFKGLATEHPDHPNLAPVEYYYRQRLLSDLDKKVSQNRQNQMACVCGQAPGQ